MLVMYGTNLRFQQLKCIVFLLVSKKIHGIKKKWHWKYTSITHAVPLCLFLVQLNLHFNHFNIHRFPIAFYVFVSSDLMPWPFRYWFLSCDQTEKKSFIRGGTKHTNKQTFPSSSSPWGQLCYSRCASSNQFVTGKITSVIP